VETTDRMILLDPPEITDPRPRFSLARWFHNLT
jgi:hypothetical protein